MAPSCRWLWTFLFLSLILLSILRKQRRLRLGDYGKEGRILSQGIYSTPAGPTLSLTNWVKQRKASRQKVNRLKMEPETSIIRRRSGPTFYCTATRGSWKYAITLVTLCLVVMLVLELSFFGYNIFQTKRSACHKQPKYTVQYNSLMSRNTVPHKNITAC